MTDDRVSELETEVEDLREEVSQLRKIVNDVDDWRDFFTDTRLPMTEGKVEDATDRVDELEAQVNELNQRMESFIGLAEDERSTPAKRAADLRDAMIRASENSSSISGGVKWWKDEVAEHLATIGHEGLHKPDLYDAMEDAATADGFAMTTKHVRTNGRQMKVKAIRLDPDDLPTSEGSREITTPEEGRTASDTVEPTGDLD